MSACRSTIAAWHRAAVLFFWAVLCFLAISVGVDNASHARTAGGVPKSASAFTKFVAKLIQEAMPSAKVTIAGRLRLDVEVPNGNHTTDLHNVYSTCRRDPDACDEDVAVFAAHAVVLYESADKPPAPDTLRIVVRPGSYLAEIRANPKRHSPLVAQIAGDYWVIVVDDRPTAIAIVDENDLSALKMDAKEAFDRAVANTRRALQDSLTKQLGTKCGHGILDSDTYVDSSIAFLDLWAPAVRACSGNLLISVPAADVVLYEDGNVPGAAEIIKRVADDVMAHADRPFSDAVFRWSPNGWLPVDPTSQPAK